jgi:hypothetical protein
MLFSRLAIEDFDRFLGVFSTRGAEKRAQHGSRGARVFRVADDPNTVIVLFDWDRAGFEGFLRDPEAPDIMAAAGLREPPVPTYVEEAATVAS